MSSWLWKSKTGAAAAPQHSAEWHLAEQHLTERHLADRHLGEWQSAKMHLSEWKSIKFDKNLLICINILCRNTLKFSARYPREPFVN